MTTPARKLLAALLSLVAFPVGAAAGAPAHPRALRGAGASIVVDGALPRGGVRLVLVRRDGGLVKAAQRRSRFVIRVSRSVARDATLQLIGADGRYLGPVVLRGSGAR